MADSATAPKATITKAPDGWVYSVFSLITGLATGAKTSLGGDTGAPSVQAAGTWGSATLAIEGSNDGTNWVACYFTKQNTASGKHDLASLTADGGGQVLEHFADYRAKTSGGTGTSITVTFAAARKGK